MAGVALLAAFAPRAEAQTTESFSITNWVRPTNVISAMPTNSAGILTGRPISVDNYDSVGIAVEGEGTVGGVTNIGNATSNNIQFTLVRSRAAQPTARDWESTSVQGLTVPMNGTARVVWLTNLDNTFIGPARWVGISRMTNTCTDSALTNATVTLTKKIRPIRYP